MGQTRRQQVNCSRLQNRGPAAAKERSPTVTRRDGRTSRRLEVDERSRPRRRQIRDVLQPVRQVLRCSAAKSSVENDRQCELDAFGCSDPVKTGQSICNMLRATKTGDRPSCSVEYRLETVKQAGREASQCRVMVIQPRCTRATTSN